VHCRECGYALYRTSTRSSARKISYYRCLGTDAWRYDGHAECEQRPVRLDLLEHIVWSEIVRLVEDPALIQTELNRRLETARNSSPTKRRQDSVTQDLAQVQKRMDRLLTAYQEDLLSLKELRRRMPAMRQREQRLQDELRSLSAQLVDQAAYLRLAETLTAFLERLRAMPRPSTFRTVSASRDCSSRRLWWPTTASPFAIRFPPQHDQPAEAVDRPGPSDPRKALMPTKVIFCVHGVLSPLLANVLLDEVDRELERRGHCFVRYADDSNVYVRSRHAGERVMALLRRLYGRLRLKVNETKERGGERVRPQVSGLQLVGSSGRCSEAQGSGQTAPGV
jgi:hypothetical protein